MSKVTGSEYLRVSHVDRGSIAARSGIGVGDRIISINGNLVSDIIDFHLLTCEKVLRLELLRVPGVLDTVEIKKSEYQPLGLSFENDIPGGIRQCCNKCVFCFVDQLPQGLRETLYVKDDDYRHSFLYGNYISLTNLSSRDWERVIRMRLSPLYISVHSTNPGVRSELFGNPEAGRIMEQLRCLTEAGIIVHTQVVVCPGINDGAELDNTLRDLVSLWPGVASVSVVPVGITKYRKVQHSFSLVDKHSASDIIARVDNFQDYCCSTLGYRFVFAADELYLTAGKEIPESEYYEDYPQLENGVGMVRLFKEELAELALGLPKQVESRKALVITGLLAANILREAARLLGTLVDGLEVKVLPVNNLFWGPSVTVTGLLTGQDIAGTLRQYFFREVSESKDPLEHPSRETVILLPDVTLKADADVFLDGYSVEDVEREIGRKLTIVENNARGLVQGALGLEV